MGGIFLYINLSDFPSPHYQSGPALNRKEQSGKSHLLPWQGVTQQNQQTKSSISESESQQPIHSLPLPPTKSCIEILVPEKDMHFWEMDWDWPTELPCPLYYMRIQGKVQTWKRALTRLGWHPNLRHVSSRTVSRKFLLYISHSVYGILL